MAQMYDMKYKQKLEQNLGSTQIIKRQTRQKRKTTELKFLEKV